MLEDDADRLFKAHHHHMPLLGMFFDNQTMLLKGPSKVSFFAPNSPRLYQEGDLMERKSKSEKVRLIVILALALIAYWGDSFGDGCGLV